MSSMSPWRARAIFYLRLLHAVGRDVAEGQITLRAMSLVYTTLLSLVPLLAVSFSVLKAFGVHNQIEPVMAGFLAPLGEKGDEIAAHVVELVENIKVGVLGVIGVAFLFYTVTTLVQKIELAFNFIWHVRHSRPLMQRFSQYLSVLTVGPVLVLSAVAITASLMSIEIVRTLVAIEPFGTLVAIVGRLLPYLLVIGAFTFIYVFTPNTRVQITSALTGGVLAGVLWQSTGWIFASVVTKSTNYTAIYSGFAIIVIFMIWLYLSWLILLVGGAVAYYHQFPENMRNRHHKQNLTSRAREKLALLIMSAIANRYYQNQSGWTVETLSRHLGVPQNILETAVNTLIRNRIAHFTAEEPSRLIPARPLELVSVKELLDAVRGADGELLLDVDQLRADEQIDNVMKIIDRTYDDALRGKTIKDLAGSANHAFAATDVASVTPGKARSS